MAETKKITIHPAVFYTLISLITALVTSWGIISASKATLETKTNRNELEIEKLQNRKVSKDEFNLIIERLDRIENKIDRRNGTKK